MKKRIVAFAGLVLLLGTGAFARSREEKKKAKEEAREIKRELKEHRNSFKNIKGTPEDSVIFYGGFSGEGNDFIFTQTNSDFEPDIQAMKKEVFFISEPVKPGSRYMLEYLCWHHTQVYWVGNKCYSSDVSESSSYTAQNSILVIDVPTEPGLYYFGYYAGQSSIRNGELTDIDYNYAVEVKDNALKKMRSYYKGTAWEPLIQKEFEEAEIAAAQNKVERKAQTKKDREEADKERKLERARKREERKEKRKDKSSGSDSAGPELSESDDLDGDEE